MLKRAFLILPGALLLSLWGVEAIAQPRPSRSAAPVIDTPVCYVQLGQQMINLNSLCGASGNAQSVQAPASLAILPDSRTGSSEESGVQAADLEAFANTGKMWDVKATSQRAR